MGNFEKLHFMYVINQKKWNFLVDFEKVSIFMKKYTLEKAKPDSTENVLLLKNPQFLSNYYETLWK